jgi:hypothetical protein
MGSSPDYAGPRMRWWEWILLPLMALGIPSLVLLGLTWWAAVRG